MNSSHFETDLFQNSAQNVLLAFTQFMYIHVHDCTTCMYNNTSKGYVIQSGRRAQSTCACAVQRAWAAFGEDPVSRAGVRVDSHFCAC